MAQNLCHRFRRLRLRSTLPFLWEYYEPLSINLVTWGLYVFFVIFYERNGTKIEDIFLEWEEGERTQLKLEWEYHKLKGAEKKSDSLQRRILAYENGMEHVYTNQQSPCKLVGGVCLFHGYAKRQK